MEAKIITLRDTASLYLLLGLGLMAALCVFLLERARLEMCSFGSKLEVFVPGNFFWRDAWYSKNFVIKTEFTRIYWNGLTV